MMDPDRKELQVTAIIGAALGVVTGYLLGHGWLNILIWGLIGAVVVVFGLFVRECFPPPPPWSGGPDIDPRSRA
jgi:hypothetical protein